jgi:hypothetical protein
MVREDASMSDGDKETSLPESSSLSMIVVEGFNLLDGPSIDELSIADWSPVSVAIGVRY